ncbi:methylenetetrahydrofolate--tRNA-(uracil(54)-C(5))-methyltransferase (FADH(2)-oxidizing) TrmFO [Desulfuribacillus stibiiarsenatis]|uniref:Methylenetetrahydrofolate--tRNA-(uracil-5-)-methyltransferase TrmFO n=1 Tax=Desulfuribacillus stibiiarsenatis TaxID=1390249 RepID=A0A1E5L6Q3_9FIRM|nr:methylenetetrahydrofolate--tRNA-(uracil(54)-C(5))-methyltransferase (FADH(2)-oxidizing) TrmFO [Desulfuribacillus stibiiarsenatis]OEH85811.1 methylenetetrahydrofolate--tRNA-(uracil(54)-C(5))-methyltransferase (FADH(2)-oxidizing) TrmFO [Desulfuribacillus stibiiarsenatis]
MKQANVAIIGAGLAGSEAAWQIAEAGYKVDLYEMRPKKSTPAHHTEYFAELVCSNSLRANSITNAVGLMKEEMRLLGSLIMDVADHNQVPAGGALAVDRTGFASEVTERIKNHENITVHYEEVVQLPEAEFVIIATGPLTSDSFSQTIAEMTGKDYLYFYDAAAPIVTKETIDFEKVYIASRYDKGEAAYINCPMTEEQFDAFYDFLIHAETAPVKEFEKMQVFEGCMPVEVMASRGKQTLLFGPMKPVGLINPHTGKEPFAVIQLRQDNIQGTLYNIVGFQTHLKWNEQKRLLSFIPGLENAEIVRYGVMHRNTYIHSPTVLRATYQWRENPKLFFAGQITGVEGYVESANAGLVTGYNVKRMLEGKDPIVFPIETLTGSLANYISTYDGKSFQPMNINYGLLPPLPGKKIRSKKDRYQVYADRSLEVIHSMIARADI